MKSDFLVAIKQLSTEKNLPTEVVLEAVETALASAYKKDEVHANNVFVRIDPNTGDLRVFAQKMVVETEDDIEDDREQIELDEARKLDPAAQIDVMIEYEVTPRNAGRIAAQTAKQVVLQRLREAEREVVFEEFAQREGDIVSGVIQRVESRQALVDLGKTEAILPAAEQVRSEHYRPGQRIKFYVLEVFRAAKGPQVIVSRTHKDLVKRLMELEVPEIFKGAVEIRAIAREAGSRTKVAVYSRQEGIDPVGACVGMRGVRIQNVVNELQGERIDIIQWDPEPTREVANALSPAQVLAVRIDAATNTAYVVVPDKQLSLAIGKEGQNARLAARLTGRRIDIKSETMAEELYGPSLEPPQPVRPVEVAPPVPEPAAMVAAAEPLAAVAAAGAGTAVAEPAIVLSPAEEAALEFAEDDELAAGEDGASEFVATAPEAPAGDDGRPQIRFAEDILSDRSGGGAAAAARARRGPELDEPVAGKPALKKKKRRVVIEDEDELDELENLEYPGLRR